MSASQQTILGLLCVPCGTRQQMAFMPSLGRTKHNRAKPMSELASALFSIADANEFRFARFYIVCEAVPLGTLESPLIVCGLSDTLRESPNVEETRNQMQSSGWKKYTHFSPTNVSYAVPPGICIMCFLSYYLSSTATCDMWQPLFQLPLQSVTVPALRSRTDDIRLPRYWRYHRQSL